MGTNHPIEKIIFFDGVCNLCNATVRFVMKRDKKNSFQFASLQSAVAGEKLKSFHLLDQRKTMVLLRDGKIFTQSNAVLEIARDLSGLWPACYAFKIIPRFIRDFLYAWMSKHRYRWFGTTDCVIPFK